MWHSHGVSRYLEAAEGVCFPMYELYYNSPLPLTVEDTFGVFFRPTYGWELYPSQLTRYGYDSVESSVTYNSLGVPFGSDTPPYDTRVYFATFNGGPDYYSPAHEQFGTIYPILAPPDTDEVPQFHIFGSGDSHCKCLQVANNYCPQVPQGQNLSHHYS